MKSKTFLNFTVIRSGLIVVTAALLLLSLFCDYREQKKMSVDRLRDQLAFTDLLKLESGDYSIERSQLEKYLRYFQLVSKDEPSRADAHAMMGYCYFYLGDSAKAAAEYRTAAGLDPQVFSFHYNLAVIAFLDGQHEQALSGFKAALTTNPSDNLD
ncbi:MAG: tetratricopeptide repeat protein, partial [Candidatus Omnitrophica bacterium]|nr:tetratricopeptide repeat protein [Candidatus Omnitrophota bacterium]